MTSKSFGLKRGDGCHSNVAFKVCTHSSYTTFINRSTNTVTHDVSNNSGGANVPDRLHPQDPADGIFLCLKRNTFSVFILHHVLLEKLTTYSLSTSLMGPEGLSVWMCLLDELSQDRDQWLLWTRWWTLKTEIWGCHGYEDVKGPKTFVSTYKSSHPNPEDSHQKLNGGF
jgi:hypothetical protein